MTAAMPARQLLLAEWQQHTYAEFELKDADVALGTMAENPFVFCVPSGSGGTGREGVRRFYANQFLPGIPPDMELVPISEIFAEKHVVAEYVMTFTHTLRMEWMLPGVAPTRRKAELVLVAINRFENGKIASEHLYWDAAALLCQLRLLDSDPVVAGIGSAAKLLKRAAQLTIPARPRAALFA